MLLLNILDTGVSAMSSHLKMVVFLSLGLLVVFGWHFATVFGLIGSAPETRAGFFIRVGCIFAGFLFLSAFIAGLLARRGEDGPFPDEREEKVLLKTEQFGVAIVYVGLLFVAWFAFLPMTPMQFANSLLAVVCLAELCKIIYGVIVLKRHF